MLYMEGRDRSETLFCFFSGSETITEESGGRACAWTAANNTMCLDWHKCYWATQNWWRLWGDKGPVADWPTPRFPDGLAGPAFQSDHLDLDTKHEFTIRPMRRGLNEESIVFGEIRLFSFQVLDKLLIGSMIAKDWGKCDKTDGSWI